MSMFEQPSQQPKRLLPNIPLKNTQMDTQKYTFDKQTKEFLENTAQLDEKGRGYIEMIVDGKSTKKYLNQLNDAQIKLADYLDLKTAIHTTSEPIRFKIFQLGELKSLLNTLNGLDTKSGVHKEGYREVTLRTYEASITEEEKNAKVKNIENSIETIQDEIDTFNATTELVGYNG